MQWGRFGVAAVAVLLFASGCNGRGGRPSPTPLPASSSLTSGPAPTASGGGETNCEPSGPELHVVARDVDYDADCLAAPADTPFTIVFENQDAGVQHNIVIREGTVRNLFEGDIILGPSTITYQVDATPAGQYRFFCVVHPLQMAGIFVVA
jgi:plastocyanin